MKLEIIIPEEYHIKAKTELQSIINELETDLAVTKIDLPALNQLGSCLNIFYSAQEILLKQGILKKNRNSSVYTVNPLVRIVNEQNAKITRYYLEFGMTPSSRLRQGKELDEEPSALDLLFAGKK